MKCGRLIFLALHTILRKKNVNTTGKMKKHINEILKKQCEFVGADPANIDTSSPSWFMEYEWTVETESKFVKWLSDYLYETKEARNVLMSFPMKRKKHCLKCAKQWAWQFGWKYKE